MGRFDYTKESCFEFHDSVEKHIVPLVKKIQQERLSKMNKEIFRPWDTAVNAEGKAPLKPFETPLPLPSSSCASSGCWKVKPCETLKPSGEWP